MMHSEQINELATALSKAQGAMTNATMNRINPHFKSRYADLASVLDAIRAPLSANGLAVTQTMEIRESGMVLRTILMHSTGQWIASEYPLPASARPQEMGSAQTYARRYSLAALVCNSADEDDDANAAEGAKQKINGKRAAPTPAPNAMVSARDLQDMDAPPDQPDAAAQPAPSDTGTSAKATEGVGALDAMLSKAAEKGMVILQDAWLNLEPDEKKMMKAALERRYKPRAIEVDAMARS